MTFLFFLVSLAGQRAAHLQPDKDAQRNTYQQAGQRGVAGGSHEARDSAAGGAEQRGQDGEKLPDSRGGRRCHVFRALAVDNR